jgi:tetratricopeptide (TPR) repeat protein
MHTATPAPPTPTPTLAISPAEGHVQQGFDYFEQEQWAAAIAEFEEAIRLAPDFAVAYLGLGYSYALGPEDYTKAIEALEKYLQLEPNVDNASEIRADVEVMRQSMADNPVAGIQIPEGKALFYFLNYTGQVWQVDVGPHFFEIPPRTPDEVYNLGTIFVDPGTYTWSAHSLDNYYIVDDDGNRAFEITLSPGDVYGSGCCQ